MERWIGHRGRIGTMGVSACATMGTPLPRLGTLAPMGYGHLVRRMLLRVLAPWPLGPGPLAPGRKGCEANERTLGGQKLAKMRPSAAPCTWYDTVPYVV